MKKCPYCAEEIQDEAIVCRYCGHDLKPPEPKLGEELVTPVAKRAQPAQTPETVTKEDSSGQTWRKDSSRWGWKAAVLIGLSLGVLGSIPALVELMTISKLADEGKLADALIFRSAIQNLAFHFCANAVIWALISGGVLWGLKKIVGNPRGLVVIMSVVIGLGILLVFGAMTSQQSQAMTATPKQSLHQNQAATATLRPSQHPTPTRPESDCTKWNQVTLADVGDRLCVYGNARKVYQTNQAFYITFGKNDEDFYMLSYDWTFDVKSGDCIQITDKIEKLGNTPVMVLKSGDELSVC